MFLAQKKGPEQPDHFSLDSLSTRFQFWYFSLQEPKQKPDDDDDNSINTIIPEPYQKKYV
jgi:hypothetical protein